MSGRYSLGSTCMAASSADRLPSPPTSLSRPAPVSGSSCVNRWSRSSPAASSADVVPKLSAAAGPSPGSRPRSSGMASGSSSRSDSGVSTRWSEWRSRSGPLKGSVMPPPISVDRAGKPCGCPAMYAARRTVVSMDRRIFGLENEYGVTCTFRGQRRLSPDEVARYLFRRVVSWGRSSNVFLRNGARLYLDVGSHPEYATAECDDLTELVVHDKAGERILEGLVKAA